VKWEYKVLKDDDYNNPVWELDKLGDEGWELVAVIQKTYSTTTFYLKREKKHGKRKHNSIARL